MTSQNIIFNHDFSQGTFQWEENNCSFTVVKDQDETYHANTTNRLNDWSCLEQDISNRVYEGRMYKASAWVRIHGTPSALVNAKLKLKYRGITGYPVISGFESRVPQGEWQKLEGEFRMGAWDDDEVLFYIFGPAAMVDLDIKLVELTCLDAMDGEGAGHENIIVNPDFEDGLKNWSANGCGVNVCRTMKDGRISPVSGGFFAVATGRSANWSCIQQDITASVKSGRVYEVTAFVQICRVDSADVELTLRIHRPDRSDPQFISIVKSEARADKWVELHGKFIITGPRETVVIYLEGPPRDVDILLDSLVVKLCEKMPRPVIENPAYGVNIIANSDLNDGTRDWFPMDACTLKVGEDDSLLQISPIVRDPLRGQERLSGRYLLATGRANYWDGPSQIITNKLKLFLTYQVSAWVKIHSGKSGHHKVQVTLVVGENDYWVQCGEAEVGKDNWHEIGGSFRLEKQPSTVKVYVHGPPARVNFMVAGLQIVPIDRRERFEYLKQQTDMVRI